MTSIRINKYLSQQGCCSRREADVLIREGRLSVNGQVAELGTQVSPADEVLLDGRPLAADNRPIYIKFHKPRGITTTTDPRDPDNIITFINFPQRVFPVGRLDKFSSGLILLTNNGEVSQRILRPVYGHEKEYMVRVERPFEETFLEQLRHGVLLEDRPTRPCQAERLGARSFRIILTEGRNRQIRRMVEVLGYRVTELRRTRIMHIELDDIQPGQWRELTAEELATLLKKLDLRT